MTVSPYGTGSRRGPDRFIGPVTHTAENRRARALSRRTAPSEPDSRRPFHWIFCDIQSEAVAAGVHWLLVVLVQVRTKERPARYGHWGQILELGSICAPNDGVVTLTLGERLQDQRILVRGGGSLGCESAGDNTGT